MTKETIDVAICFDTTGSMYPCIRQVRQTVEATVHDLFDRIPGLRISIMGMGDYCDRDLRLTTLPLTSDRAKITKFIREVPNTGGGDADECYEYALNQARSLDWTAGKNKAFVLIGDANPHPVGYKWGPYYNELDWRNEAELLAEAGIKIIPVQALGSHGTFYSGLSKIGNSPHLLLPQFSDITDILCAICFQQAGKLDEFVAEVEKRPGRQSTNLMVTLDLLAGRKLSKKSETIGSRFQVLDVLTDQSIKEFVEEAGLTFKKGRGFYEFTKAEKIQEYKVVIAQNRETGAILEGKAARKALGIPEGRVTASPGKEESLKYLGFVQSTSVNRKLKGGTRFLYEVPELAEAG